MEKSEFNQLRHEANHLLTCIDLVESEGALLWAKNLRMVARVAAEISSTAKTLEDRERRMNWRPADTVGRMSKKKCNTDSVS